ncbi:MULTISPECIES: endopeptidase La [Caldilinea]|uniref:Lon protease n=1 Tax=Caldilinea aerophila (strain DSM 14535 / JCM 11387 / NBRC 104270 / STL-6-O1) TaxID=926550 RepID=I0HZ29_CALAS|nr:ATP-dependent protease La [Caldilinea aerophila DSM 14535 = NBRC 104270]
MDDWESGEDEVIYESEEFREQNSPIEQRSEPLISDELPVLPLRGVVVYPMMWLPLPVGQERSLRLVEDILPSNRIIALVTSKDEEIEEPAPDEVYRIGTAAQVHRVLKTPDGTMRLLVQGLERIRLLEFTQEKPYLRARIEILPESVEEGLEMEALMRAVQDLFRRLIELEPQMPDELTIMSINVEDARQLAYLVASSMRLKIEDAQAILEMDQVRNKLLRLIQLLKKEIEVLELGRKIQSEAQGEMERMQREFFLREQMRAIQKELGEEDEQTADIRELEERIAAAGMSEEAEREALHELARMRRMPIQAAEYSVIKTYLDLLVSLPWRNATVDNLDISHARKVLDEDHYGLTEIKERILEFLAVRKLRAERRRNQKEEQEDLRDKIRREREGLVLCFVGPPGVGKTSLGLSIARAMNRKFVRLALGGVRDEADIRGFRRTYIGAMPGRIIQSLRRVESRNPVFMLDEVDKLGRDFRGDPSSALLEVLDPEQNREFRDHYLDVAFDLSQVLFITTANVLDTIPPALRDRMEIIQLSSYTEDEKVNIAKGYLVPRQIKENGLRPSEVKFTDDALREIIQGYTREAGVRNLERQIGKVCRKIAAGIAAGEIKRGRTVKAKDVATYLGKRRYFDEEIDERLENPGVAIGLVWTEAGGDITFFEATRMPGAKGYILTGQLGDVMKESAQAALSYVRSRAESLGIDPDFFTHSDIHLHIPEGAIPKDGPSAGITMATALASLLTNRPVRPKLGMTGEITLRGKVLPVGGVKEKVLAAARYGLDTVILPRRNDSDLDELPEAVRKQMKFILVDTVDEVLAAALLSSEEVHAANNGQQASVSIDGNSHKARRRQLRDIRPSAVM